MSKREQALSIEPKNEIHFKGPYNRVVTEYFHLKNPTEKSIAFKVKTTAPKRYCVRPNNGTIKPGATVTVAVMLQPLATADSNGSAPAQLAAAAAVAALEKNKHKFMIQSVFAASESGNAEEMFKQASPDDIMDSKFRCVFDDFSSATGGVASLNSIAAHSASSLATKLASASDSDLEQAVHEPLLSESAKFSSNDNYLYKNSSTSSTYLAPSAAETLNHNGGDEDVFSGTSTGLQQSRSIADTTSSLGDASVRNYDEENRELRSKIQDLERALRSMNVANTAPYSRFQQQSQQPTSPSLSAEAKLASINQESTKDDVGGLFDIPLTGQTILTIIVSLLIGIIIGKVDLGIF